MSDSFTHLHVHTEFSMLDGAARLDEMVAKAVADGQPAIGMTDHGNMYGTLEFYKECNSRGIKPIIGTEAYMILLLAAEDAGVGALFFGVFKGERELRQALGVPAGLELLGALALGYPADPEKSEGYGTSASRPGRPPEQIIRRGGWSTRGASSP